MKKRSQNKEGKNEGWEVDRKKRSEGSQARKLRRKPRKGGEKKGSQRIMSRKEVRKSRKQR